jgi:hypothetical protein
MEMLGLSRNIMEQEVIKEKEIEFELRTSKRYKCNDCGYEYTHIERCKDGKDRCKRCKKKLVTNIFYNPNWRKENNFIGKFSINDQEKKMLMKKYIDKGCSYNQAKQKINYDIFQLRKCKERKYFENKLKEQNLEINKMKSKEMKSKLLEGLGQNVK